MTIEKILVTHGHIDHCGAAGEFAKELGVHDRGAARSRPLLDRPARGRRAALRRARHPVRARPLADRRRHGDGRQAHVGRLSLPRAYAGARRVPPSRHRSSPLVGDVLFQGSIGRTDFPLGNHQDLLNSITGKLWPLGGDTVFIPGHGPAEHLRARTRDQPIRRRFGASAESFSASLTEKNSRRDETTGWRPGRGSPPRRARARSSPARCRSSRRFARSASRPSRSRGARGRG